ncbi:hypothetical protein PR048_023196 [Dryococelus australis]|uniref:Uncharacterized protein n=1 Tax=Dryococelus australis TaxID=614101 RepID=A0ABQ9GTG3_9NEOP|nr:hypothetical protein PR048_023196 [Dryococelus australis]
MSSIVDIGTGCINFHKVLCDLVNRRSHEGNVQLSHSARDAWWGGQVHSVDTTTDRLRHIRECRKRNVISLLDQGGPISGFGSSGHVYLLSSLPPSPNSWFREMRTAIHYRADARAANSQTCFGLDMDFHLVCHCFALRSICTPLPLLAIKRCRAVLAGSCWSGLCDSGITMPRDVWRRASANQRLDASHTRLPPRRSGLDPGFRTWESCWTMSLVGGSSRGAPIPPTLAFQRRSILGSRVMFRDDGHLWVLQLEIPSLGGILVLLAEASYLKGLVTGLEACFPWSYPGCQRWTSVVREFYLPAERQASCEISASRVFSSGWVEVALPCLTGGWTAGPPTIKLVFPTTIPLPLQSPKLTVTCICTASTACPGFPLALHAMLVQRPFYHEPPILNTSVLNSTLASHQGEPVSMPGRVTGFSQVGVVPDDTVGRRISSGVSRFPTPSFRRRSIFTSITLIGSQDLANDDFLVTGGLETFVDTYECLRVGWTLVGTPRPRTRSQGAIRATLTRTLSASSLLRARLVCSVSVVTLIRKNTEVEQPLVPRTPAVHTSKQASLADDTHTSKQASLADDMWERPSPISA